MTNQTENFPDLMSDDSFEVVMRGYSRRQVHDYMIRTRNQIRDLEERLARTIDQAEQSRMELAEARRKLTESPQNPDELGERLSQILKLAHEEAAANKEASQSEATRLRDQAQAEAERLVTSAREQADAIRAAAQEEAERRVAEATLSAERLLAQAGSDADETLGTARAEAEDTLRDARSEADRQLTAAKLESEKRVADARAEAESTLSAAQQRVSALDEHTGRRVTYLTDTHTEVMRRLNEIGAVLGDLLHRETAAGPIIDEAAVLPPPPRVALPEEPVVAGAPAAAPAAPVAGVAPMVPVPPALFAAGPGAAVAGVTGNGVAPDAVARDRAAGDGVAEAEVTVHEVHEEEDDEDIRVIVDAAPMPEEDEVSVVPAEDTDVNLARVRAMSGEGDEEPLARK
jgi:cell division septum initiation protein DivIVA